MHQSNASYLEVISSCSADGKKEHEVSLVNRLSRLLQLSQFESNFQGKFNLQETSDITFQN